MDQRFYPIYDPEKDELYIVQDFSYDIGEYRGHQLSTYGYDTEEDAIDALEEADLPNDVSKAFAKYKVKEGVGYTGLLD